MKILNVVGARPNFMKIAPIMEQMKKAGKFQPLLLHTGQHYDENMNQVFFDQLQIPRPDIELGVGSGTQSWQIAEVIKKLEPVLLKEKPSAVLVVGDVNSTVATAMVASYQRIPVIHVEAGLRSFDWNMPEEINRVLTDRLSEFLFITESSAAENLKREGIDSAKVHFVGNVMVDTLFKQKEIADKNSSILKQLNLQPNEYLLMTLHRPSNVDDEETLRPLMEAVGKISKDMKVVFAIHPRTAKKLKEFNIELGGKIISLPPQPYLDTVQLMSHARLVLTDSGGMQEETTALGVPCLTLRENTERPVTVDQGTNKVIGADPDKLIAETESILSSGGKKGRQPDLWDGKAAERIIEVLLNWKP
jgi:UDP-N-acetylglucosamine 2-epimerase (non-hydrolysing)